MSRATGQGEGGRAGAPSPVIRLRGASIGYDDRAVVRDLDFELVSGEVVAVLGANGSGKSTLIKGVLGLARILSGSLELFGVPAKDFRDRARIGYVPQRHTLGATIPATAREIVSSGRLPRTKLLGRLGPADRQAVDRALDVVGLADRARSSVSELSGGQQRRVLIARALASEPDVLVMDEPTAGVDASSQHALATTLQRLVADDLTLVVVSHEIGPMAPLVTRAVVMHEGRARYDGSLVPSMLGASDGVLSSAHDNALHNTAHTHHGSDPQSGRVPGWVGDLRIGG